MKENIFKTSVSIPGGLSKEDLNRIMSEAMGKEILLSDDFFEEYKNGEEKKYQVRKLIEPFYSNLIEKNTRRSLEKVDELIDLGKFIYWVNLTTHENIEIVECDENMIPDFVVKYKDQLIGVEHTRLIDNDIIIEISELENAIKKAAQIILEKEPTMTGLFNIYISSSVPLMHDKKYKKFDKTQKKEFNNKKDKIPNEIAEYLRSIKEGLDSNKPDFIEKIVLADMPELELRLNQNYFAKELTTEKLIFSIRQKEDRIENYLKAKELKHCWLLLVIQGVSSKSSFKVAAENLPKEQSKFDQLLIFQNFTYEINPSYPSINSQEYIFIPFAEIKAQQDIQPHKSATQEKPHSSNKDGSIKTLNNFI